MILNKDINVSVLLDTCMKDLNIEQNDEKCETESSNTVEHIKQEDLIKIKRLILSKRNIIETSILLQ